MSDTAKRVLSPDELDTIGEIMNISMGSAATAISTMLERQVVITTPSIEQERYKNIDSSGVEPALLVKIRYTEGIDGVNTTMLKRRDMQIILDILMGNDEPVPEEEFEFDDMSMSAACEIMNQMMGASATALSEVMEMPINISTPEAVLVESLKALNDDFLGIEPDEPVIAISFHMSIKDVLETSFITFLPVTLAVRIVDHVNGVMEEAAAPTPVAAPEPPMAQMQAPVSPQAPMQPQMQAQMQAPVQAPMQAPIQQEAPPQGGAFYTAEPIPPQGMAPAMGQMPQQNYPPQGWNAPPQQQMPYAPQYQGQYDPYMMQQNQMMGGQNPYPPYGAPQAGPGGFVPPPVTVKKAEFPDFSQQGMRGVPAGSSNMGLLMGVQLEVSVIIGKTKRKIKDIMDFGQGTVVELDKQTGAPAEIVVNGQLLAYGDVIVVGDNFGVRITEIVGSKELVDLLANNG